MTPAIQIETQPMTFEAFLDWDDGSDRRTALYWQSKTTDISIYTVVDGEYEVWQFRGSDRIVSRTFENLELTAEQVFQAGR